MGNTILKPQLKYGNFNYLVNMVNGEFFPATDFYFYPLTVDDYVQAYSDYTTHQYPLMAFIYMTNRCTDNCVGCFAKSIKDPTAEISLPVMENTLYDLAEHGTKAIKLAGREPTVYPYLSESLELADRLNMKSLVITSAANIDRHAEALSHFCSHLRVSVNTVSEEKHNLLHRPTPDALRYNERMKYVEEILKVRQTLGLVSGATFLIRENTVSDIIEFTCMCKELGFNYVRFTVLDGMKAQWQSDQSLYYRLKGMENDSFSVIFHEGVDEGQAGQPGKFIDTAIMTRVTIHANGDVNSCHEGWRATWPEKDFATYGNINSQSFYEIWTGEKRKRFMDFIANRAVDTGCCQNCKYDSFNRIHNWLITQLSYPDTIINPVLIPKQWS